MVRILNEFFKKNPFAGDALKLISHYPQHIKKYKLLKKSQWWSKDQLKKYQFFQLKKLLNHTYENVPYYSSLFDEHKINLEKFTVLEDIQEIPYLTKEIIKKNINKLRAKNYPQHTFEYVTSGGTTDYPLGIYFERGVGEAKFLAFYQRMLDQSYCRLSNKHSCLMSEDFLSDENIYKYQIFRRILFFSSFHLNDENLSLYVEMLKKHKPKFIVAFPSAIVHLARFMNKNDIDSFSSLKTILCSGETLYDWQRYKIEKTFDCRVHAFYSHNEQTVFATTCNNSNYYHILPEYGITELINRDDKYVIKENEMGEIVGTGFNNYIFPLIRYKTGDTGIHTNNKCECGREFPLLKKIQRGVFDFIITKNNQHINPIEFYDEIAKYSKNVIDWQLIQETKGEVLIKIIKDEYYSNEDEQIISKNLKKMFVKEIKFIIQYTDQIPLAPSGKKIFFIQKLT